jgi:uncharacterized protein (TIRG00374 family)
VRGRNGKIIEKELGLVGKLLRWTISIVLLTRVACTTDWDKVSEGFAELRLEYWIAAVGLLVLSQLASAWRWKFYADQLGLKRPLRQLTGFYFVGMYFNLMLPTSVGGDVVRAWYLDSTPGRRLPAFASVLLDRINGLMVLVGLACLSVTLCPLELPNWIPISIWSIAGCGVVGMMVLQLVVRLSCRSAKKQDANKSPGRMEQLRIALDLLCKPRTLVPTLFFSLLVQAANVVIVWLIGKAIHAPIPAAYFWVMVPMVSLLTLLPISVNGMGVREEATVLFLAPLGVAKGTALTLSVLWFAVYALVSLMGGAVYFLGHFPKPESPAKTPAEVKSGSLSDHSDQGRTGQSRKAA